MSKINRRDLLRYSAAAAVVAGTGAAIVNLATPGQAAKPEKVKDDRDFDEVYKGKKIKGVHKGKDEAELHINDKKLALTTIKTLIVPEDGATPYVATALISAINHYQPIELDEGKSKGGLKKLAMKVVDILGEFELSDEAAQEHQH